MTISAGADGVIGVAFKLLLLNMSQYPFQGTVCLDVWDQHQQIDSYSKGEYINGGQAMAG